MRGWRAWRLPSAVSTAGTARPSNAPQCGGVSAADAVLVAGRSSTLTIMNERARVDSSPIPFIDLEAQRRRIGSALNEAMGRVLGHCQFILGPEVRALEAQLAEFCGARHAVSCASGTDALLLVLMAKGVGAGDAVICPSFTFTATAEVVALAGATPVFADVDEATFNLDAQSLARACATARKHSLRPEAVSAVHL